MLATLAHQRRKLVSFRFLHDGFNLHADMLDALGDIERVRFLELGPVRIRGSRRVEAACAALQSLINMCRLELTCTRIGVGTLGKIVDHLPSSIQVLQIGGVTMCASAAGLLGRMQRLPRLRALGLVECGISGGPDAMSDLTHALTQLSSLTMLQFMQHRSRIAARVPPVVGVVVRAIRSCRGLHTLLACLCAGGTPYLPAEYPPTLRRLSLSPCCRERMSERMLAVVRAPLPPGAELMV